MPCILLLATAARAPAASIRFNQTEYVGLGSSAFVIVEDSDLDTDPGSPQSVVVRIISSSDGQGIELTLTETGNSSATFRSGPLEFSTQGSSSVFDQILVSHGDLIAAIYQDLSPFEQLTAIAVWFETAPAPSPTPSPTPTPSPVSLPTSTPTSTATPLPLFTPVPRPTQTFPRLLLVDDDGSPVLPNVRPLYEDALTEVELPFDVVRSNAFLNSNPPDLEDYEVLLWFTGEAFIDTLTLDEQEVLEEFFEEPGKALLLSSQDYLYELSGDLDGPVNSSSFASHFLGLASVENDVLGPGPYLGVQGTLTQGMELILDPDGPLILDADRITHRGQTFLTDTEENPTALLYETSTFKTAFFALPLETIMDAGGNNRLPTLLRRTICAALFDCGDPKAEGRIFFNKGTYYSERDQAVLTLFDSNLNSNPDTPQFARVGVGSTFGGVTLTLEETGPNTGVFDTATSGLNLRFSTTLNDSSQGILQVFDGELIWMSYGDASPPGGSSNNALWFDRPPPTPSPTPPPSPGGGEPPPAPGIVSALARLAFSLLFLSLVLLGGQLLRQDRRSLP